MVEGKRVVAGEAILGGGITTDASNAERIQVASPVALLEALVREHSRLVYRISYAALRRHHDAEDATQETFMRVLRYRSKLDEVKDPKTWLARIAWRVAIDRGRQRRRSREITLDDPEQAPVEPPSTEVSAADALQREQLGVRLEKLIAALPRKLRDPLILSAVKEMSPPEVAATLGINEAAVRSRVFRARQILKEKLSFFLTGK